MFSLFFTLFLLGCFAWVTWKGLEAWPFSAYPMFAPVSPDMAGPAVAVYRVQVLDSAGTARWWEPPFPHLTPSIHLLLRQVALESGNRREAILKVLRRFEHLGIKGHSRIRIIQRRCVPGTTPEDHLLEEFSSDDFGTCPPGPP